MSKEKWTKHHTVPKSRGGKFSQIKVLKGKQHQAYHILFGNMLPEEVVQRLCEEFFPDQLPCNRCQKLNGASKTY